MGATANDDGPLSHFCNVSILFAMTSVETSSALHPPPPSADLLIFGGKKQVRPRNISTILSTGEKYQTIPSELTVINHLALFPN